MTAWLALYDCAGVLLGHRVGRSYERTTKGVRASCLTLPGKPTLTGYPCGPLTGAAMSQTGNQPWWQQVRQTVAAGGGGGGGGGGAGGGGGG
ncbi:MAG: hypothetical protein VKL39_24440, partial [Leptolyngbyaceae bacterium]|nr:hypothetical protein [Leptolyngbyaceae bacterium]